MENKELIKDLYTLNKCLANLILDFENKYPHLCLDSLNQTFVHGIYGQTHRVSLDLIFKTNTHYIKECQNLL